MALEKDFISASSLYRVTKIKIFFISLVTASSYHVAYILQVYIFQSLIALNHLYFSEIQIIYYIYQYFKKMYSLLVWILWNTIRSVFKEINRFPAFKRIPPR